MIGVPLYLQIYINIMIKTKPKYFKFTDAENPTTNDFAHATGSSFLKAVQHASMSQRYSKNMAKLPVPLNDGIFDIVKKFRWTKSSSDSVTVHNTPTITLREMEVINPAFFNNLALLLDQLTSPEKTGFLDVIAQGPQDDNPVRTALADAGFSGYPEPEGVWESIKEAVWNWTGKGIQDLATSGAIGAAALKEDIDVMKKYLLGADHTTGAAHLRNYERIYGIHYTNFTYKIPYLEDSYKQINNSWGGETTGGYILNAANTLSNLTNLAAPSVGVDFAKTFDYPQTGPSYDINFFLDNTVHNSTSMALDNFTFIYLLLYQNLPNRINRTALAPPVIYQASLPSVFSYRWSFLSKINVNFVGVRRPFNVNIGGEMTKAIIPEGYEVQLTLTSLTPETKNLFFDSLNSAVNVEIKEYSSSKELEERIPVGIPLQPHRAKLEPFEKHSVHSTPVQTGAGETPKG